MKNNVILLFLFSVIKKFDFSHSNYSKGNDSQILQFKFYFFTIRSFIRKHFSKLRYFKEFKRRYKCNSKRKMSLFSQTNFIKIFQRMMKKLGYLLNESFWERIFYNLIYSNFNQELFDSTDEANFQNFCYLVFISLLICKHYFR